MNINCQTRLLVRLILFFFLINKVKLIFGSGLYRVGCSAIRVFFAKVLDIYRQRGWKPVGWRSSACCEPIFRVNHYDNIFFTTDNLTEKRIDGQWYDAFSSFGVFFGAFKSSWTYSCMKQNMGAMACITVMQMFMLHWFYAGLLHQSLSLINSAIVLLNSKFRCHWYRATRCI